MKVRGLWGLDLYTHLYRNAFYFDVMTINPLILTTIQV